jgi:hypothetical protein
MGGNVVLEDPRVLTPIEMDYKAKPIGYARAKGLNLTGSGLLTTKTWSSG